MRMSPLTATGQWRMITAMHLFRDQWCRLIFSHGESELGMQTELIDWLIRSSWSLEHGVSCRSMLPTRGRHPQLCSLHWSTISERQDRPRKLWGPGTGSPTYSRARRRLPAAPSPLSASCKQRYAPNGYQSDHLKRPLPIDRTTMTFNAYSICYRQRKKLENGITQCFALSNRFLVYRGAEMHTEHHSKHANVRGMVVITDLKDLDTAIPDT